MRRTILYPLLATVGLALAMAQPRQLPAEDTGGTPAVEDPSLDALLLETLDEDLLEGLDILDGAKFESRASDEPRDLPDGDLSDLDKQLLDQLDQGEDLGQEAVNPLMAIGRRMRMVEDLISQRITSDRTQRAQELIVADLDLLIEELQSQCKKGQCEGGQGTPKPNAKPGGKSQGGSGENRGANKPAQDSTDRLGTAQADSAEVARMKQMLKQVWGHLPTKVREQMQSGTIEEFLPKYQTLIEAYYSRLAEDQN